MKQINISTYKSPLGELLLGGYRGKLVLCDWKWRRMRSSIDSRIQKFLKADFAESESDIGKEAVMQLDEYFAGRRQTFDLPLLLAGTEFQISVWHELLKIPFGKTETYMGLARKMGNLAAIRAIGLANGANAISIIVPCHRIIGSTGELVGYAGGLPAKKKLLELEQAHSHRPDSLF